MDYWWQIIIFQKNKRPYYIEIKKRSFFIQPTYAKIQPMNHEPGVQLIFFFEKASRIAYSHWKIWNICLYKRLGGVLQLTVQMGDESYLSLKKETIGRYLNDLRSVVYSVTQSHDMRGALLVLRLFLFFLYLSLLWKNNSN